MTQRIILFNGPPRSGKDTAAKACLNIKNWYEDVTPKELPFLCFDRMSMPIKKAFAATVALPIDKWGNVDYWEAHKSEPIVGFGVSYRQWQIDFSEKFMKPLYGEDIFGKLFISRAKKQHKDALILVPDCGFDIEYTTLAQWFGERNVLVVQIIRPGASYEGDSRNYLRVDPLYRVNVQNDGIQADFESRILQIVKEWLEVRSTGANPTPTRAST